jgi:hypothetical protein
VRARSCLQLLPIGEAAPIYEKLLATFPTAVSPVEVSTKCLLFALML